MATTIMTALNTTESRGAVSARAARVVNAPIDEPPTNTRKSVFLSGGTDPKTSADWRAEVVSSLAHLPITFYDPYRPDWDSTWKEEITFVPFREQVEWELGMLALVDVIAVYFAPLSQAPITLLELGLFASTGKVIVACPKGYWRRGNVEIVCARYGIKMVESLGDLIEEVKGLVA